MADREFIKQFDKRVHCRLNILGINQRELARRLDVSENTVSRYLNGRREVTFEMATRIADALECTPNDLIYDED